MNTRSVNIYRLGLDKLIRLHITLLCILDSLRQENRLKLHPSARYPHDTEIVRAYFQRLNREKMNWYIDTLIFDLSESGLPACLLEKDLRGKIWFSMQMVEALGNDNLVYFRERQIQFDFVIDPDHHDEDALAILYYCGTIANGAQDFRAKMSSGFLPPNIMALLSATGDLESLFYLPLYFLTKYLHVVKLKKPFSIYEKSFRYQYRSFPLCTWEFGADRSLCPGTGRNAAEAKN